MGEGSYITLFSPSDVTEFHRMKYGGGGLKYPCFHRVTSLRFTELGQILGSILPVGIPTGSPGLLTSRTRQGHIAVCIGTDTGLYFTGRKSYWFT